MEFDVRKIDPSANFTILGTSYIGKPKTQTAMFVTKKVGRLIAQLEGIQKCLIFAEKGVEVPDYIMKDNCFVFVDNPQLEYAKFATSFEIERFNEEKRIRITSKDGYYVSESAVISPDAYIEPGCFIGHHVTIGENARIYAGSVIKNSTIGNNFLANECAVVGANGFTMATDENGDKIRIPTLGRVVIGNNVEVGAHDNISCGSGGDTILEDNVKLDAFVHIGHDACIKKNAEITARGLIGGFDVLEDNSYIGLNATLRNRITIGAEAFIGMGAVVTKDVPPNETVVGNPARKFERK